MTRSRNELLTKMKYIEKQKAELIEEINRDRGAYGLEPHQRVIDLHLREGDILELVIVTEQ
jgi:hypothetical protein